MEQLGEERSCLSATTEGFCYSMVQEKDTKIRLNGQYSNINSY